MKTRLGALPYIYPIPITLVGAQVDERANFTTIGDLGLLGINPALVCISSHRQHHLNRGILDNQTFSINFPTTEMLAQVDYCGLVSGREVDKGALFEVFYGDLENTPLIMACPVNLECRVVKEFSIQHRQVFVGEVVQTHVNTDLIQEIAEPETPDQTIEKLVGIFDVLKPHLLTTYEKFISETDAICDAPTIMLLEDIIRRTNQHIAWGNTVLDELCNSDALRERRARRADLLNARLAACGGVTGEEPVTTH